ncbi:MAG: diaminopimelate epimerase [Armatimonadetes bacterium]|nr:diaminopimelate epimerase [Armatimonadota bacterium]
MLPPKIHFHKWQGIGNDFVVLDLISHPLPPDFDFSAAALALCERRLGVGADGLLSLEPAVNDADLQMRMWNPDGSEDMCGNGLRCVAALAWAQEHVRNPQFSVQTRAGNRDITVLGPHSLRAAMGAPIFEPSQVPIALPQRSHAIDIEIRLADTTWRATALSTGSTHTVVFLENPLCDADFGKWSPLLENHPLFPQRTSVMWAVAEGAGRFKIRIWERGVGETLACGTGACAVAVAAQVSGRSGKNVAIESRGGVLEVEWTRGEEILLTGSAHPVFQGVWNF